MAQLNRAERHFFVKLTTFSPPVCPTTTFILSTTNSYCVTHCYSPWIRPHGCYVDKLLQSWNVLGVETTLILCNNKLHCHFLRFLQ